jgi:hypothetical protein
MEDTNTMGENAGIHARRALLRTAWSQILSPEDTNWINSLVEQAKREPNAPGSGAGAALRRLLKNGVDPGDITKVVRVMQYEALFGLFYSLEDPPDSSFRWKIFLTDEDGSPQEPVDAVYESLLSADPTGRELRPLNPSSK